MFAKSLDNKEKYTVGNNIEVIDLGNTIFEKNKSIKQLYNTYKVSKEYEMRPDLVSKALYGTTDYTEMLLKYSTINNPFSLETGDIIYAVSIDSIYHPVKDVDFENTEVFSAIKNYHKYIDKNKVPDTPGSEKVPTKVSTNKDFIDNSGNTATITQNNNGPIEANITKTGNNGITIKDGKIYFGSINDMVTNIDSSIVDCAVNGTTIGEFLTTTIRNS